MKRCAVIPAAGMGSRLGGAVPKILAKISETETVWTILRNKLLPVVDHIHLILSPAGHLQMTSVLKEDIRAGLVSVSIQKTPRGMGDALFCGYSIWSKAEAILLVWGDQVFVSLATLTQAALMHGGGEKTIVLPLVTMHNLYVEYVFDQESTLIDIKQAREGDRCSDQGLADVGTFVLSTAGLKIMWDHYLSVSKQGHKTQEINFLPFLVYLAKQQWKIKILPVENSLEARGINTPDDLLFFQSLRTQHKEFV